jgi:hypothetical protein
MKSDKKTYKLPFQTKIVFSFVLLLTFALVSKWAFYAFFNPHKVAKIEEKFSGIKLQVNDVCLKEESKNLKSTAESAEEDQDWMNVKAPEYCRCISNTLITLWNEKAKLEDIGKISTDKLPRYITSVLKGEESKSMIDFCLSKAQRVSSKKVTASAVKN